MRRQLWISCLLGGLLFGLGYSLAGLQPWVWGGSPTGSAVAAGSRRDDSRAGLLRRLTRLEELNARLEQRVALLTPAVADSPTAPADAVAAAPVYLRPLQLYPVPGSLRFCGEELPLEQADIRARFTAEFYRLLTNRHWVLNWMERSPAVFPLVEERLRAASLPEDLKYVMVIESALDPRAVSPAEAVGYWQFVLPTGSRYGLRRDDTVDERRDLIKATDAAIAYLRDLHGEFESWPLTLAGYNAGEQRIRNAVMDQGTRDFYSMVLPRETEAYWFRAAAVKLLFEHPATYDFPPLLPAAPTVPCDTLLLKVQGERLALRDLAAAAGLSYRRLHDLNPALLRSYLPRGSHRVALPRPSIAGLLAAFPQTQVLARAPDAGAPGADVAKQGQERPAPPGALTSPADKGQSHGGSMR
jgi:membrane-bound lytic murein transglycosylase D